MLQFSLPTLYALRARTPTLNPLPSDVDFFSITENHFKKSPFPHEKMSHQNMINWNNFHLHISIPTLHKSTLNLQLQLITTHQTLITFLKSLKKENHKTKPKSKRTQKSNAKTAEKSKITNTQKNLTNKRMEIEKEMGRGKRVRDLFLLGGGFSSIRVLDRPVLTLDSSSLCCRSFLR